jgi:transposase
MIFVGNDWAEDHHDVWVMDEGGEHLAYRRFSEGISGVAGFHELMAGFIEDADEVVIGVETDRGLWVEALVGAGYQVYAVNPKSVSRYRDRHSVSGAKSDRADAKVLADMVRTDRHNLRQVAGDTDQALGVKVLARAHQRLIWDRQRQVNRLRSALREFYPAALETFGRLAHMDAVAILMVAPTPQAGAGLSKSQIKAALKRGGRKRNLDAKAAEYQDGLRTDHLEAPPAVASAFGVVATSMVTIISELNRQITDLETELANRFREHPDADIYLSIPGCGDVLGARVLGEFGDDPERYATGKSRRNYAATSPLTIASGKNKTVIGRYVRNDWLFNPAMRIAFCSLRSSDGCKAFYDERVTKGDSHNQALRALANRLVGILHGCLKTGTLYDEDTAWAHRQPQAIQQAA